jgi:glycosyltransferase involved in cell wall biosynthesis
MPTLDVVVPCYNYSSFLERCVASALNQEGADVRVLVIDDCSSDDTALIGRKLAGNDPRVEFRRHEQNQGHIATYNEGLLGWAKADYSLLLSADDAMVPGAFLRAQKLFDTSSDVGLVYGMGRIITHDDEFRFPPGNDFASARIISGEEFLKSCCELCINPVPTPTAIVRTAWQQRLGGYRSDLPHTGDLEMWMRFALNGSVGVVRSVQGEYRWHGANMGLKYYSKVLGDRREFALTCLDALKPIQSTNPDVHSWIAAMYARLLVQAQGYAFVAFENGDMVDYKAWHAFARELSGHMQSPPWLWRLTIRDLLGSRVWRLLRSAQRTFTNIDRARLNIVWSPSHGEVNGWWPDLAADS